MYILAFEKIFIRLLSVFPKNNPLAQGIIQDDNQDAGGDFHKAVIEMKEVHKKP